MSKHCASSSTAWCTVASIRRRLVLERHLPPWEAPTPENLLRYYGYGDWLPAELREIRCRSGATYHLRATNFEDALAYAQRRQRDSR